MAQSKVSDFFSNKKNSSSFQPSKRLKLDPILQSTSIQEQPVLTSPPPASRTRSRKGISATISSTTQSKSKIQRKAKVQHKKCVKVDPSQPSIAKSFSGLIPVESVASASYDDHNASPPSSPRKSKAAEEISGNTKRLRKAEPKDLLDALNNACKTPDRGFDFSKSIESENKTVRKKLVLKSPTAKSDSSQERSLNKTPDNVETDELPTIQTHDTKPGITASPRKTNAKKVVCEKKTKASQKPIETKKTLNALLAPDSGPQKTKSKIQVTDIDTHALKAKLIQNGKFAELQAKLDDFSQKKKQFESTSKNRVLADEVLKSTKKAPAHERFDSLASPSSPTLSLPFKYKLLSEMFRGVDQVVSMLYKRSETCTFSKLKASVQQLIKKNFEEKNLGQIKTVYPTAYEFRQEKGLHTLTGGKSNTYQLTVEPKLELTKGQRNEDVQLDKYGKPVFTASHLTERYAFFHRRLIGIVMKHHKEFLAKLDQPLKVDDKEIKRWHPKFKLDSVPDVDPSSLPQKPQVKTMHTAAEVLEHAKGGLNARIQRALMLAAGQVPATNTNNSDVDRVKNSNENKPNVVKVEVSDSNKSQPKENTGNTKLTGVSQSLLDRIRAKEAAKTEAAMLRSPEEEVRLKRIERLPDLVRILRTVYVTQKKPALLLDDVINKLGESYKSNMGRAESEKHVELLVELVPDWLQIVNIKRGKFIKMDKNKDMNAIQEKLQRIFKQAK